MHVCTPSGKPKIKKITATTLDCAGCDPNNEGATMKFDVVNTFPTDTCITPKLDDPATTDFGAGSSAVFEGDSLGQAIGFCVGEDGPPVGAMMFPGFDINSLMSSG